MASYREFRRETIARRRRRQTRRGLTLALAVLPAVELGKGLLRLLSGR